MFDQLPPNVEAPNHVRFLRDHERDYSEEGEIVEQDTLESAPSSASEDSGSLPNAFLTIDSNARQVKADSAATEDDTRSKSKQVPTFLLCERCIFNSLFI